MFAFRKKMVSFSYIRDIFMCCQLLNFHQFSKIFESLEMLKERKLKVQERPVLIFSGGMEGAAFDLDLDKILTDPHTDLMLSGGSSADVYNPFLLDDDPSFVENTSEANGLYTSTVPYLDGSNCLLDSLCSQLDAQENIVEEEHSYASVRSKFS